MLALFASLGWVVIAPHAAAQPLSAEARLYSPLAQPEPPGAAATPGKIEVVRPDDPVLVRGTLSQGGILSGNLRLRAVGGDVTSFTFVPNDLLLVADPSSTAVPNAGTTMIQRQHITLVGDTSLTAGLPKNLQVQVSGIEIPGTYSGTFTLLYGPASADALAVGLSVDARATVTLSPLAGTDQLRLNLARPNWWAFDLFNGLLPRNARIDNQQLEFDNTTLAPVTVTSALVVARGEKTGYQVPASAFSLQNGQTLPADGIVTIPVKIDRRQLPPDHYTGNVYLTLAGSPDRVKLPLDMNVRDGVLWPMLAILTGIALGRLFNYMRDKGGALKGAQDRLYVISARVRDNLSEQGQVILGPLVASAQHDIDYQQTTGIDATLNDLDSRYGEMLALDGLERQLQTRVPNLATRQPLQDKLDLGRATLGLPGNSGNAVSRARQLREEVEASLAALLNPPAPRGRGRGQAETLPVTPTTTALPSMPPRSRWEKLWSDGRVLGSRLTIHVLPHVLYVALLVGLTLIGLQTLYVENGPTFGAQPISDYLSLVLWGLTADVASSTLGTLPSLARLPKLPSGGSPAEGAKNGATGSGGSGGAEDDTESGGSGGRDRNREQPTTDQPAATAAGTTKDKTTEITPLPGTQPQGGAQPAGAQPNPSGSYYALLIGINNYPPASAQWGSLRGCVNDIDAIEALLLPQGAQVTRLASTDVSSTSSLIAETKEPTRDSFIAALKDLIGSVAPGDRVMIYYSGHGDQLRLEPGGPVREALVGTGSADVTRLYDLEVNRLISVLASRLQTDTRPADLTIIFDSCHSGGATKGLQDASLAERRVRSLRGERAGGVIVDATANPLDQALLSYTFEGPATPATTGATGDGSSGDQQSWLFRELDPNYIAILACDAHELAQEAAFDGATVDGALTLSLVELLKAHTAKGNPNPRWSEVYPALVEKTVTRSSGQHPRYNGRLERKVFGGPWEQHDAGLPIRQVDAPGEYVIGAGTLVGLTEGSVVRVYGADEPRFFSEVPLGDTTHSMGDLVVGPDPGLSECRAIPLDPATFNYPGDGNARGRIIQPGKAARLRVLLKSSDQDLVDFLGESALLTVLQAPGGEEVLVTDTDEGGWLIGDATTPNVATVPAGAKAALLAGLNYYAGYRRVLNMAHAINELSGSNPLRVRLLNCNDDNLVQQHLTNPSLLPEFAQNGEDQYRLRGGPGAAQVDQFSIEITNGLKETIPGEHNLTVATFLCSAFGRVALLDTAPIGPGNSQVIWSNDGVGVPFEAVPSSRRGKTSIVPPTPEDRPETTIDRLVIIGTNKQDADFTGLIQTKRVQDIVDEIAQARGRGGLDDQDENEQPKEIWVAKVLTLTQGKV
jgi:hypothetical protein